MASSIPKAIGMSSSGSNCCTMARYRRTHATAIITYCCHVPLAKPVDWAIFLIPPQKSISGSSFSVVRSEAASVFSAAGASGATVSVTSGTAVSVLPEVRFSASAEHIHASIRMSAMAKHRLRNVFLCIRLICHPTPIFVVSVFYGWVQRKRVDYFRDTSTSPVLTVWPLVTLTLATTPSRGALISFSIFMASRITRSSPFLTD